jgi:hypothetical protein
MIIIENTLLSEDILEKNFICDIEKCKGACCIEGDAGAPLNNDELIIIEICVDQGPTLKRMMPRARGRADRLLKPTSHVTITVAEQE